MIRQRARTAAVPVCVGLAAAALALIHLFVPTTIGNADTGDGLRLLCQLQAGDAHFYEARNSSERFVAFSYRAIPKNPVACGKWRETGRYLSSALVVLGAAKVLTHVSFDDRTLDLRFAGILYSLLYGLAIGLLVVVLPGPSWARLLTAGGVGILGADATFVPYFISPFSEPMEFVTLLLSIVGLLALWRRAQVPLAQLVLITITFALLLTAKTQDTPLVAFLAIALLSVRCAVGRLTGRVTARLAPAVAAAVLLAVAGTMLYLHPKQYHEQLIYTDVFYTILKDSPNPRADLAEMDLPTGLAKYAGRTWFETRYETAKDPDYKVFLAETGFGDIAKFYANHPDRLRRVSADGMRHVVKARHPLPNTTRANSERPEVLCRICIVAGIGPKIAPAAPVLWPLWVLTVLLVGALLVWRRWQVREWRALGLLLVTIMGFSVLQYSTAVLGDGYAELGKHVFPAVVTTWLSLPLVALGVAGLLTGGRERSGRTTSERVVEESATAPS